MTPLFGQHFLLHLTAWNALLTAKGDNDQGQGRLPPLPSQAMSMSSHSSISHLASARHFACSIFNRSQWSGIRSGQWGVGSGQRERERVIIGSDQFSSARFSVLGSVTDSEHVVQIIIMRKSQRDLQRTQCCSYICNFGLPLD